MADSFTLSVIQSGLEAAAQEMFETLRKTAMSPIIYEVLDVGTGVMDADGALVSSGAGIPGFVGVLDKSVKAIIRQEKDPIVEGDMFILNDPNHGGVTHLNDIVIAQPIFHDANRVGWVASIAHWGDIGGKVPGSMAVDVVDNVAEGLRLPPVKLFAAGKRNQAVFDIIQTNTRLPEFVMGDLSAQIAAGRRGAEIVQQLHVRYGKETVAAAISSAFAEGVARAKVGLSKLPKGRFPIAVQQDDGSVWNAAIDISADRFVIDLTQAPPAYRGPQNTCRDGTMVVCQIFFKALTDADRFANEGSFAPLEVRTNPGTIFDVGPIAPQGFYFETRIRLFDMLWQAMAKAMPGFLPSGHFATIFGTVIAGTHPDTGRRYTMVEPQMGGWGATPERPGTGPLFSTSHGDTFACPAEVAEARYGFEVVEKRLSPAPKHVGFHVGGAGITTRYRMTAPAALSAGFSHAVEPVWSQATGQVGGKNKLQIRRKAGGVEERQFVSGYRLVQDDEVEITTAYGGACQSHRL